MSFLAIQSKKKKAQNASSALPSVDLPSDVIELTEAAAAHVHQLLASEKPEGVFRIGIVGGGCSGFSYHFAIEESPKESDRIFEKGGVRVCVDPKSLKVIGGSVVDWFEQPGRRGFRVLNKNATKSCSCGESFTL